MPSFHSTHSKMELKMNQIDQRTFYRTRALSPRTACITIPVSSHFNCLYVVVLHQQQKEKEKKRLFTHFSIHIGSFLVKLYGKLMMFISYLDIDECILFPFLCAGGQCENVVGSYICICPVGYTLDVDSKSCRGEYIFLSVRSSPDYTSLCSNRSTDKIR